MPELSVIIPVYNAEEYIVRCIDSLLSQTLESIEVIIVDDHGQDDSIKIIQNHIVEHPRKGIFQFTETPVNSGPGPARNMGLQMAQGEYVAFLDSDDWVEKDMYATLYETAIQYSADLCYCNIFKENIGSVKTHIDQIQGVFSDEEKRSFLANFKSFFTSYIYRRKILNDNSITFFSGKSAEDTCFLACAILCAKSVAQVGRAMYHYTYDSNSLSRFQNEKRYLDRLSVFRRLFDFAKTHDLYDKYRQELQFIYLKKAYLSAVISYLINAKRSQAKILREIYQELVVICPDYAQNTLYKRHLSYRLATIFLRTMPSVACLVLPPILRKKIGNF